MVKNIIMIVMVILLCGESIYLLSDSSKENRHISNNIGEDSTKYVTQEKELNELRKTVKEDSAKLMVQEIELNELRKTVEEENKNHETQATEILELTNKLREIESLESLITDYRPMMAGPLAIAYGSRLAQLTEKEGVRRLISILTLKDQKIIRDVSSLLFGEYLIHENNRKTNVMLNELASIDMRNMSDKEKGVVFNLRAEGHATNSWIISKVPLI